MKPQAREQCDVTDARARLERVRVVASGTGWAVVDKPSGVLSVPGKGESGAFHVVSWVLAHFKGAWGPITVHRLDMDTSGLLLVALDALTQRALSMQFESRTVEKRYEAVVSGRFVSDAGRFDVPMRLDPDNRPRQVVDFINGKPAMTEFRVLERFDERTRLELVPVTGRTHQLRVHCANSGHPILGDVLYGRAGSADRLMLHATHLLFTDPVSGERVGVESPAPF